jgi:uncharacterized membrane protein YfcA
MPSNERDAWVGRAIKAGAVAGLVGGVLGIAVRELFDVDLSIGILGGALAVVAAVTSRRRSEPEDRAPEPEGPETER